MRIDDINNKEFLSKGCNSKCYIIDKNNVYKEFNTPLKLSDIGKFKYLLEYKDESFIMPIDFVYDNHKFYGYISKRFFGKTLMESFSDSDLLNLSKSSESLEKGLEYISKGKIYLPDLHSENILYDGNKLCVIDLDDYEIDRESTADETARLNLNSYRMVITNLFLENLSKGNKYILNKLYLYKSTAIPASQIILEMKDYLDKHYKTNIQTINDIKKISR